MDQIILLFHLLLVDPMSNVLVALARVFGGNYGMAIIVFTLVMKFITWPLTSKQYKQSRAMQSIQPQMQELQKKYKGKDPKKLQAETMALYREAGVNPIGCIIPMLVQFPIWIALYQVIRVSLGDTPESLITLSGQLYPIPFIHQAVPLNHNLLYWNLGQPDKSYVLPLFVAASMYVQQKLIMPAPSAAATAQSAQQQQTAQMMTWMMPLMFGFWSLTVPAGLALYWAVSNISGIVLQYFYMGRKFEWKSLLQIGPPSPAPAITGRKPEKKIEKMLAAPEDEAAADIQIDESGEATLLPPPSARRNKNGKRRGKR
jgi:YidC/Oxa1 family membrane protein insertase